VKCYVTTACYNIQNPPKQSSDRQTFRVSYKNEPVAAKSFLSATFTDKWILAVTALSVNFILAGGNVIFSK